MISSIPKWIGNLFESLMQPNVNVLDTNYISPDIKRIRFQGDISKWNFQIGYASVVRVSETEFRNYTIAHHDKDNGIFDIIFHIHGNGVGSQFIDNLKAGDELFISLPRGKKMYDAKVKQQLFFGDETSLGIACALLPLLKKDSHQFEFYFELNEENKNVPELLGLDKYTVFPGNGSFHSEKWIGELPVLQNGDWQDASFVLTGNARSVQTFRKVLKNRNASKISSQGYWLEGKIGL